MRFINQETRDDRIESLIDYVLRCNYKTSLVSNDKWSDIFKAKTDQLKHLQRDLVACLGNILRKFGNDLNFAVVDTQ